MKGAEFMPRVKYTTKLDEALLKLAKEKAKLDGLDGANSVNEIGVKALLR
jgi:hypothetical protein